MRKLIIAAVAAAAGGGLAAPAFAQSSLESTLNISATVDPVCELGSGSASFDFELLTLSPSAAFTSDPQTLTFTCSGGTEFSISADSGQNPDGAQRQLIGAADDDNVIQYTLLNGGDPWADQESAVSTGSQVTIPLTISIPATPTGTFRAADTYSDQVTITIEY